jgi:predicted MFS family arabinose efflux permease
MNKYLRFLLFINSINIVADYLLIPIFALFIKEISDNPEYAGILFAVQFMSSAFFGLIMTRTKDATGLDAKLLRLNYVIKAFAWMTLAFSQNLITLFCVQILIGAATAIGAPAFQSLVTEHLDTDKHISDWSISQLIISLAVMTGSVLSGFIFKNFGFTSLFLIMAALEFVAFLAYSGLERKK